MKKVTVGTLRIPPVGWQVDLEVEKGTTVVKLKELLTSLPGGPRITPKTKVLNSTTPGQIYTLNDDEKATRSMLVTDPTQEAEPPPQYRRASVQGPSGRQPQAQPQQRSEVGPAQEQPLAAGPPAPAQAPRRRQPPQQPDLPDLSSPGVAPRAAVVAAPQRRAGPASPPEPAQSSPGDSGTMRKKLLGRLLPRWVRTPSEETEDHRADNFDTAALAREQEALLQRAVEVGDLRHVTKVTVDLFGRDRDAFRRCATGAPVLNEIVLALAGQYYSLCKPLLANHGWEVSVKSLARMDRLLTSGAQATDTAEVVGRTMSLLCFGGGACKAEEVFTESVIWMSVSTAITPAVGTFLSYLQHLALPPLQRRRRALPRTIAWVELLLQQSLQGIRSPIRPLSKRVFWVVDASPAWEERIAREGLFEDVGAFRDGECQVCLIGDALGRTPATGRCATTGVSCHPWSEVETGGVPWPSFMICATTGIGNLDRSVLERWLPRLAFAVGAGDCVVVTTSRSETEALREHAILDWLGARPCLLTREPRPVRNLFSAMAGNPDVDFDEHGWWMAYRGTTLSASRLEERAGDIDGAIAAASAVQSSQSQELAQQGYAENASADGVPGKSAAVFWGILDLKYNPAAPPAERVKVLETGDGRCSKFSGCGAAIKEAFEQEHRLEETIRCAVLTENKKLTHDTIVECGYGHLRPRQAAFPRVYSQDLAARIREALGLPEDGACILKLCNRTRGAGVIPVPVAQLDASLRELLRPPGDVRAWLLAQPEDCAQGLGRQGSSQEQLRHWWSNECPVFLAEELCVSAPVLRDGRAFDGTMRVAFCLHKETRDRLPAGWLATPEGAVYVGEEAGGAAGPQRVGAAEAGTASGPSIPAPSGRPFQKPPPWGDERAYLDLFRPGEMVLRVQWLGGYWKLPLEDDASGDLRAKVVSVAKQGTAAVPEAELADVYTALGDMVCLLFNTNAHNFSHTGFSRKYSDYPAFGAFVSTRLACSMRFRDRQRSMQILELAEQSLGRLRGPEKDLVRSYIQRNRGVYEAMHVRWSTAAKYFHRSLETMPTNATSRCLLGLALLEMGDDEAAARSLWESLILDPDFRAPYVNLAVACLRLGEYRRAADVSRQGLNRHPDTPQAMYNLAMGLFASVCLAVAATSAEAVGASTVRSTEFAGLGDDAADKQCLGALASQAAEALEEARVARTRDQLWTIQDDAVLAALRRHELPAWPRERLPRDGWRILNWRP